MKEVYIVCKHRMVMGNHEEKEIMMATTDYKKAKLMESELDSVLGQWGSITTEDLVE